MTSTGRVSCRRQRRRQTQTSTRWPSVAAAADDGGRRCFWRFRRRHRSHRPERPVTPGWRLVVEWWAGGPRQRDSRARKEGAGAIGDSQGLMKGGGVKSAGRIRGPQSQRDPYSLSTRARHKGVTSEATRFGVAGMRKRINTLGNGEPALRAPPDRKEMGKGRCLHRCTEEGFARRHFPLLDLSSRPCRRRAS